MAVDAGRFWGGYSRRFLAGSGTVLGSGSALAGNAGNAVLQYGPPGSAAGVTSIPTMSGVALILLSALLMLAAWRLHRNGRLRSGHFMAVALVGGALASGLGGVKMVSDVIAQPAPVFKDMNNNAGGALTFLVGGAEGGEIACVRNATDVAQEVLSMQGGVSGFLVKSDPGCDFVGFNDVAEPSCAVGLVLAPSEICGASSVSFTGSDARLKTDVTPAGRHASGLALYEFRYIGGTRRYRGVMAQDVLLHTPEAVAVMPGGYLAVNYGMLGLNMVELR